MKNLLTVSILFLACSMSLHAQNFENDVFETSKGELKITFIGHGTLMFECDGKTIHIDPVGNYADYNSLPKADLILITHDHGDHLDVNAIETLSKADTEILLTEACTEKYTDGKVIKNGDSGVFAGLKVDAVPAYNLEKAFHPKGAGNGYVIYFGDKKVYVAGDTENVPEMANLKNIDIAFLPMNLPFTMTPEMVVDAVKLFNPKILYPYHFGQSDTDQLIELMEDQKGTEVRIRKLS